MHRVKLGSIKIGAALAIKQSESEPSHLSVKKFGVQVIDERYFLCEGKAFFLKEDSSVLPSSLRAKLNGYQSLKPVLEYTKQQRGFFLATRQIRTALLAGVLGWKDAGSREDGQERQGGDVALRVSDQLECTELQPGVDEEPTQS